MKKLLFVALVSLSFSSFGQKADKVTLKFIKSVERAVLTDDPNFISNNIQYPIKVTIKGSTVSVKDKRSFLNLYPKIINSTVKQSIYDAMPFDNSRVKGGFMLGNGALWIYDKTANDKGNIIFAINN